MQQPSSFGCARQREALHGSHPPACQVVSVRLEHGSRLALHLRRARPPRKAIISARARRRRLRRRRSRRPRDRRAIRDRERPRRCGAQTILYVRSSPTRRDPELQRLEQLRAVIGSCAPPSARGASSALRAALRSAQTRTAAPALPSRWWRAAIRGLPWFLPHKAQPGNLCRKATVLLVFRSPSCRCRLRAPHAPASRIREGSDCRKESDHEFASARWCRRPAALSSSQLRSLAKSLSTRLAEGVPLHSIESLTKSRYIYCNATPRRLHALRSQSPRLRSHTHPARLPSFFTYSSPTRSIIITTPTTPAPTSLLLTSRAPPPERALWMVTAAKL